MKVVVVKQDYFDENTPLIVLLGEENGYNYVKQFFVE